MALQELWLSWRRNLDRSKLQKAPSKLLLSLDSKRQEPSLCFLQTQPEEALTLVTLARLR